MKTLTLFVAGAALAVSGVAFADSANWNAEKAAQVFINRCADAGVGNGGEKAIAGGFTTPWGTVFAGKCYDELMSMDEDTHRALVVLQPNYALIVGGDLDPGNSGDHNANNE